VRAWFCLPFITALLFAENPQPPATVPEVPANLSIPAQLTKTISTDKSKSGDAIEMKTLEPVLLGKGIVMPANAALHGRIAGAASRKDDKPSWLVVVVERAEWKGYAIPLHAFISAQITIKEKPLGVDTSAAQGTPMPLGSPRRRVAVRDIPQNGPGNDLSSVMRQTPQDATVADTDTVRPGSRPLDDIHIFQDKNGTVFLLSQKPHLKLSSGTMFMLRNHPLATANPSPTISANPQ
jgi:hypothetical protein